MLRMLELDESSIAARLRAVRKRIKSMKRKTALLAAIAALSLAGCETGADGSTRPDPKAIKQIGGILGDLIGQARPAPAQPTQP